jgi:hypothetical protein
VIQSSLSRTLLNLRHHLLIGLALAQDTALPKVSQNRHRKSVRAREFFAALSQVRSSGKIEPVRVMHFGDSHVAATS